MITNHIGGTGASSQSLPALPQAPKTQIQKQTQGQVQPQTQAQVQPQNTLPLPEPKSPQTTVPEQEVKHAVEQIQEAVNNLAQNLQFSIDEDTGKTVVKILDSQTQEVIRQFPSEEAIAIARTLDKVQGLLFNDKA